MPQPVDECLAIMGDLLTTQHERESAVVGVYARGIKDGDVRAPLGSLRLSMPLPWPPQTTGIRAVAAMHAQGAEPAGSRQDALTRLHVLAQSMLTCPTSWHWRLGDVLNTCQVHASRHPNMK